MTQLKAIVFGILILQLTWAFEENTHFCIRTDPLLLNDIERHINPIGDDPRCEILATTLTTKEKETLHKTMCKDYGSTRKDEYQFFQLHNGHLKGRGNHQEICDGKRNFYLAWVPYSMIQSHFAAELNPKERTSYIAKATDVEREKTELCHFRHSDLATNISANLFTCIVMVFEDNFYGLDSNINVLVEIMPLMYEVRNVTYLPWTNVTFSYKTQIGTTTLKNESPEPKQIYGSVSYAYVEKVKLNLSSIYGERMEHLPVLFGHRGAVLELDNTGIGGVNVKEKAFFGRNMDSKTSVAVELIGQWAENRKQFTADIYEYFGYGIKRFGQEINGGEATIILIQNTEPIYEKPESSQLTSETVYKRAKQLKFARLSSSSNDTDNIDSSTDDNFDWEAEEFDALPPGGGHPYPNFYPWAVVGGLIVGAVLLVTVIGMVRTCSKEKNEHKYRVTGSS